MSVDIIISPNDQDDITDILQNKLNELVQNQGGRLLIATSGEFFVKKTIVIPVLKATPIVFEGTGSGLCALRGQGMSASEPVFQWDTTNNDTPHVDNFTWRGMTVRHNGGGTAIQHKSKGRRFWNCLFEDLFLLKTGSGGGSQPILDIEGVLHSTFRDLYFQGLGIGESGFRISGSHANLENIYVPKKCRSPSQFLDFSCGNSRLCHLRTEGGNCDVADYWIHDCQTVDIQNVHSEGEGAGKKECKPPDGLRIASQNIMQIENCEGITLTSIGIAIQPKGKVTEPTGLRFVNSSYCTLSGSTGCSCRPRWLRFDF